MDRFIVLNLILYNLCTIHLKSNMDRFIVISDIADDESVLHLKSNMDRFIGTHKEQRKRILYI